MRTTLTLEDRLAEALKRRAHEQGKPFKEVINEALRAGLQAQAQPSPRPYRLDPTSMGRPRHGYDLAKAREISEDLEDAAVAEKLEQRK